MLYTIAGAAERTGLHPTTLRDYCRRGLVTPLRDSAARRLFAEDDLRRIRGLPGECAALPGACRGSRVTTWADVHGAAQHVHLSVHALRKMVERHTVPHGRAGRKLPFSLEELDAWVRARGSTAQQHGQGQSRNDEAEEIAGV